MRVRGYDLTYPRILLVALVFIVATAAIFGLSTSSTAFGSYNPAWDGTSDMRALAADTGTTTEVTQSTTVYAATTPNETTAFVLSPTEEYGPRDIDRVSSFVTNGGTLVVASDFEPEANTLLAALNVSARVDGRAVRDERHYYRSPALPVATNVTRTSLTANVSQLTLNHASVVQPGQNSSVLVNTSGFAYLDTNGNEELDDAETVRERPVVVSETVGDGRVLVVSDPSVFINAMLDAQDNQQFATNLLGSTDTAVFDYSHRAGVPWAVAVVLFVADTPLLQFLVVGFLVGVCVVVWRPELLPTKWLPGASTPPAAEFGMSDADVVARITARHPEWDDRRVERVARGITSAPSNEDDNE